MSEWKEYMFTEVATLTNGRAYLQPELQDSGKYKIVRVGNLSGGDKWFYSDMELPDNKYCNKGDLLYAWACSFGPYIWNDEKTIYHYHIWKVDVNATVADKMFLYYYLKYYTPKWMGLTNGSVMMHITKGSLEKQKISLPPLETQQRISSILSSLDSKIENNRKICANLEAQAQALFKHWFIDFAPFKDGKFVESELGMIPEGWRVSAAMDLYNINIGKTPPRQEPIWFSKDQNDVKWISISDLGKSGIFIMDSSEKLTKEAIKKHHIIVVPKNTILLSFKLTIGRVAICNSDMTTNEAIARFYLNDKSEMEYLYMYLKNYKYELLGSTSSIATAVNSKIIKKMCILKPPFEVIKKFHSVVNPLFERIRANIEENDRLSTLRDTLLPKLMSGEIKV